MKAFDVHFASMYIRGHDESPSSNNHENFIEMIKFIGKMNESIGSIVLEKAQKKIQSILHRIFRKIS